MDNVQKWKSKKPLACLIVYFRSCVSVHVYSHFRNKAAGFLIFLPIFFLPIIFFTHYFFHPLFFTHYFFQPLFFYPLFFLPIIFFTHYFKHCWRLFHFSLCFKTVFFTSLSVCSNRISFCFCSEDKLILNEFSSIPFYSHLRFYSELKISVLGSVRVFECACPRMRMFVCRCEIQ